MVSENVTRGQKDGMPPQLQLETNLKFESKICRQFAF